MMSISTRGRVHFWTYRLDRKLFDHETWPTNNTIMDNIFRINFACFGRLGPKSKPYLIYQTTATI